VFLGSFGINDSDQCLPLLDSLMAYLNVCAFSDLGVGGELVLMVIAGLMSHTHFSHTN
jgi:hypothetical protein